MGEGESDTPRAEQFFSRDEEREFRPAVDHDPYVQRAVEIMTDAEPDGSIDHLLDELLAEKQKPKPDAAVLADIRQRLEVEHTLLSVQERPADTARSDEVETKKLNDREEVVGDVADRFNSVHGLELDIREMAEKATPDLAETYSEEISDLLDELDATIETMISTCRKTLRLEGNTDDEVEKKVRNQHTMVQQNAKRIGRVYKAILRAHQELVDIHARTFRVTSGSSAKNPTDKPENT